MNIKITKFKNFLLVLSFWIGAISLLQAQAPFITTWSVSTNITIPTNPSYTYNYDVDWNNDGIFDDFGVTGNITHSYSTSGTYQVAIRGTFPAIYFNDTGDRTRIVSIDQWGDIEWQSMLAAFAGCSNLGYTATDTPNLTNVTSLRSMFFEASSFNGDLSDWNVANVTNMYAMFYNANSFNGYLSNWNVANVTNMAYMFFEANSFNSDLSNWNVANVTTMYAMFFEANSFNSDLSNWNVANVTTMHAMFYYADSFNSDLSNWNVANVTTMYAMFYYADSFNSDLGNWNVANVTTMEKMFRSAHSFNSDLSNWNVTNVTNLYQMFYYASSFNSDLSNWNVANVMTMENMFYHAHSFNGDVSNWSVANVTNMNQIFYHAHSFDQDLSTWNVANLTDMSYMFYHAFSFNGDLSTWDVSNVTDMSYMFAGAPSFNGDLSTWDVSNVTTMKSMFYIAASFDLDLSTWNISNVVDMSLMLWNSGMSNTNYDSTLQGWSSQSSLQQGITLDVDGLFYCSGEAARNILVNTYQWDITGDALSCNSSPDSFITTWKTDNPYGLSCTSCITIPAHPMEYYNYDVDWDNDGVFDEFGLTGGTIHDFGTPGTYTIAIRGIFPRIHFENSFNFNEAVKLIRIEQWGNIQWGTMETALQGCGNLIYLGHDVPNLSNVTSMSGMFSSYGGSLIGNIANWDVSNITNMSYMFSVSGPSFSHLYSYVNLNSWNTSNVTEMIGMFGGKELFNGNLSNWDVSNVTNMRSMFNGATNFNGDLSNWDVSSVTNIGYMFKDAREFRGNLSAWNVANVAMMDGIFYNAENFNGNISNWNTSNVVDIRSMFREAESFNGDISSWNVSNVQYMVEMFWQATSFNQDISNWNTSNVVNTERMFKGAISFNQNIGNWNTSNITSMKEMFNYATSFDQNIGNWDMDNVVDLSYMLSYCGMSTTNYDNTLIDWVNQGPGIERTLGADGLTYCVSESARNTLLNNYFWTIVGDDLDCSDFPPCETPTNTQVNVTSSTTALVTWNAVTEATNYQVWYRLKGTPNWTTTGSTSLQRNLPNLTKNKYYQYKVRANCASGWSDFSDIETFYTSICDIIPTGIAAIYLDNTRMRIRWDNIGEVKAKVRYREVGTSTWYTQNSADGNNYVYINDLTPNATYQYRVRSNCEGNEWSAYSASYFHDLMTPRMSINESLTAAKIYPNPTRDLLNIEFETNIDKKINITISDHLGKVIHTLNESYPKGIQRESIDMSSFANGYYFITIQGDDMMKTFKFVKVK